MKDNTVIAELNKYLNLVVKYSKALTENEIKRRPKKDELKPNPNGKHYEVHRLKASNTSQDALKMQQGDILLLESGMVKYGKLGSVSAFDYTKKQRECFQIRSTETHCLLCGSYGSGNEGDTYM